MWNMFVVVLYRKNAYVNVASDGLSYFRML